MVAGTGLAWMRGRLGLAACLAVPIVASLPGCRKEPPPRVAQYAFDLTVTGVELPDRGAQVVYDDVVLGRLKPKSPSVRVMLSEDVWLLEARGRLKIRVDGTCGEQDIPLRIPFTDRQQEAQALRKEAHAASFESEAASVARVYYDNDAAPATSFTIGAFTIDVAAGDRGFTSVVLGTCATSRQIFVAGTKVGELPVQPLVRDGVLAALVDLRGGRCYRRRVHTYGSSGDEVVAAHAAPPVTAAPPTPPPPAKGRKGAHPPPLASAASSASPAPKDPLLVLGTDAILKGQRVYPVGLIDDFLSPSPSHLVQVNDPKLLQRLEVVHCEDLVNGKFVAAADPAAPAVSASASASAAAKAAPAPRPQPRPRPAQATAKKRR